MTAAPDPPSSSGAEPATQAERTALAWRRTALGVGTGAVVAARLVSPATGAGAYVLAILGGGAALVLFGTARSRYRAALEVLADGGDRAEVSGPGLPAALLAGLAALTGLAGLAYVVLDRGGDVPGWP